MARLAMGGWGAQSERIRALALAIVRDAGIAGKNYQAEVLAVHCWVQSTIRYTRDPVGQETVQTPEHTAFVNQAGDCDDFSVLEAALLGALGHPTRFITIGYSPKAFSQQIDALIRKLEALVDKYRVTYADNALRIQQIEAELAGKIDELVGNTFDMNALAALKAILAGGDKHSSMETLKPAAIQKMSPPNVAGIPEIRFRGFTKPWENAKLNKYLEVSTEISRDGSFGKEDVLSVSGSAGVVNQIAFQGRSFAGKKVDNYGVVRNRFVVYTKSSLKSNPYGILKANKLSPGIVSALYAIYKPRDISDSVFVQSYFELDSRLNSYLRPLVNKGAKNDMKVSDENALLGPINFPEKEEQKQIGTYFSELDELISRHATQLEKFKNIKTAFLEKMFV